MAAASDAGAERAPRRPRRALKTAEIVALEIVRDIVERGLASGAPLPLEAEMLAHYRVSRSSLREALRLLETQGLIAIRPGPGGTVVGQASPEHLGRTMTLHFHTLDTRYDELLDSWLATEPLLAEFAARNPDAARRERAMAPFLSDDPESACLGISTGRNFHQSVADLADNRALSLLCQAMSHIVSDQVLADSSRSTLESFIVAEHAGLAQAIIAGEAPEARRLMHAHIEHLITDFKAYWPERVGERVAWR